MDEGGSDSVSEIFFLLGVILPLDGVFGVLVLYGTSLIWAGDLDLVGEVLAFGVFASTA